MTQAACDLHTIHGLRLLRLPAEGPLIRAEADADQILGEAWGREADLTLIPVERLGPEFFRLETGLAGLVLQKFTTYRLRVVILGDLSAWTAESKALSAFVAESNRGEQVWFSPSQEDLERRLAAARKT